MSQGKRAKVRAATRHREGVAREIAASQLDERIACGMCQGLGFVDDDIPVSPHGDPCTVCEGTGSGRRALALALLSDPSQGFDVRLAREHAEQLIAEATVRADKHYAAGNVQAAEHQGGRVRLGRRILAALEGQPSACQGPRCDGGQLLGDFGDNMAAALNAALTGGETTVTVSGGTRQLTTVQCSECSGTGHNLRGVLPAVEVSAQLRRKDLHARRHQFRGFPVGQPDDRDIPGQYLQAHALLEGWLGTRGERAEMTEAVRVEAMGHLRSRMDTSGVSLTLDLETRAIVIIVTLAPRVEDLHVTAEFAIE